MFRSEDTMPPLRLWSPKAQRLRLPADADALRVAKRQPICRGIRWADSGPSGVSVGPVAVRWAAGEGTAYAGVRRSVCVSSDGEPATSLFHPPPPEPGLQDFRVPGSPVIRSQEFSILACRLPYSLPPDRPVPLRHVSGFPGRGLLWGLRHLRARAP